MGGDGDLMVGLSFGQAGGVDGEGDAGGWVVVVVDSKRGGFDGDPSGGSGYLYGFVRFIDAVVGDGQVEGSGDAVLVGGDG